MNRASEQRSAVTIEAHAGCGRPRLWYTLNPKGGTSMDPSFETCSRQYRGCVARRERDRARAHIPWTARRLSHARARLTRSALLMCCRFSLGDCPRRRGRRARGPSHRPHAHCAGHHDRHRLSGRGRHLQGWVFVRGLTTAASIWITAAIGLLFGAGLWVLARWRRLPRSALSHSFAFSKT